MHILVLYNSPTLPPDHPDAESEREVVEVANVVAQTLEQAGYRVSRLGISTDPTPLLETLRADRPDAVFNLFEGTAQHGQTEAYGAGLLEWFGVPYTGCPFQSMVLARDKPRAKMLLRGAGLPTPAFFLVEREPVPLCPLPWPVIVKPATEDGSVGLDQGSVVCTQPQLAERVARLLQRFRAPVLVEEFINGREFNVAIIENPEQRVLPVSEIVFRGRESGRWPIVTYASKWLPGSAEDLASKPHCPAEISPALAERLGRLARQTFQLFGCRDYARVDFRMNDRAELFLLEVNPNPDLHPTCGFARALGVAGVSYSQFTIALVQQALSRGEGRPTF